MNKLHKIIEKVLLLTFGICFAFVSLYIPQNFNQIKEAEAGAWTGGSTFLQQAVDNVVHVSTNAYSSVTSAATTLTSSMASASFALDNVIDGIAWALAKNILSQMTSSIVNWVNSGFEGSPSFVTNMQGFLLDISDKTIGSYLEELGGPYSFICAPFKLDVRLAVTQSYQKSRNFGQTPSTCTLTGALANLDKFVDSADTFVGAGGWDAWFKITSNPSAYTPQGSIYAAEAEAQARITNAKGEEVKLLDFGQGFLSSKICTKVENRENCTVSTPGKVINEALTFQTSTGPQSLVAADEINEIISAVFAQVTQKALTGAAGLLGLSGGTGYTDPSLTTGPGSFMDDVLGSGLSSDPDKIKRMIEESRNNELNYKRLALHYEPLLLAEFTNPAKVPQAQTAALDAANAIRPLLVIIDDNISLLDGLLASFALAMAVTGDPELKSAMIQDVAQLYFEKTFHSKGEIEGQDIIWQSLLK